MHQKKSNNQDKTYFQNIKLQDRPQKTRQILAIPQKHGKYPTFKINYVNEGKWKYKNCQHHYYYQLNQKQTSKIILFYFHGLNSHGGNSGYFTMGTTKDCSADIYSLDFENFGKSGGTDRGMISSSTSLIQQAQQFIQSILQQQKTKKKVYISGLSLGGAICFKLAIRHPQRYDGVIFLSPAIRQNKQSSPLKKKVGIFLGSWFPSLRFLPQTYTQGTKYNQQDLIDNDPYVYKGKVILGTIKVVLQLMRQIQTQWTKFKLPYIMIQSGADKLVDPFQAIDFQKQCTSSDKTTVYFKDMWHAVLLEDELPQVVKVANQWLLSRINQ